MPLERPSFQPISMAGSPVSIVSPRQVVPPSRVSAEVRRTVTRCLSLSWTTIRVVNRRSTRSETMVPAASAGAMIRARATYRTVDLQSLA